MNRALLVSAGVLFGLIATNSAAEDSLVFASLTGSVRDADGKPIAGAKVKVMETEGFTQRVREANGSGVTDSNGRYTLSVLTKPSTQVRVVSVRVEAVGFVPLREDFLPFEDMRISAEARSKKDFALARGEALGGVVALGNPPENGYLITIRGASFRYLISSKKDGSFRTWVPKGTYSLEAFDPSTGKSTRVEKVASGRIDVKMP
jgi:hypothetical protein